MQQEQSRPGVAQAVEQVAPHQKGLAGQAVHHGGDDQRQQHHGDQLNGHHQRRGQSAACLVKDQKGQGELTDDPPAAPSVVAAVMRVKFRVQRVCFIAFTSLL